MTIEIKKATEEVVLEVTGRLDTMTAPALEKTINENLDGIKSLILDLQRLEYVSSAGLRVLLGTQKKMQEVGEMKLKNVCQDVLEVFDITGFIDILTIE